MYPPEMLSTAGRQHGVIAVSQLRSLGLSARQVRRLRTSGHWKPLSSQVLRRRGTPLTAASRVSAAVLDVGEGAVLTHASAAAWWGHRGSRLERPVHVSTVRSTRRRSELARIHEVRELPPAWATVLNGVAVARPELVALQLFGQHRPDRAERIVDSMWSQRLLSGRSLGALLDDLGRSGRNGTAGLRAYHDARGEHYVPPDSGLESRVAQILRGAGVAARRQVDLGGDCWSGRVDFLLDGAPVVIEVQSALHHSALSDRSDDAARIGRLEGDGFIVVEVTDTEVWTHPALVVSKVRAAEAESRASVLLE